MFFCDRRGWVRPRTLLAPRSPEVLISEDIGFIKYEYGPLDELIATPPFHTMRMLDFLIFFFYAF